MAGAARQVGRVAAGQEIAVEAPQAGEVAVRVTHCGVCHSDLSLIDGQLPASCPIVLGHEAAGVVSAVGPGVTSLVEGDHVVLAPCPPCGYCYHFPSVAVFAATSKKLLGCLLGGANSSREISRLVTLW